MTQSNPMLDYALAIQADLDEALKEVGLELGNLLDTRLSQAQMETLNQVMQLYQQINTLASLQRANWVIANTQKSDSQLIDVDAFFRKLKEKSKDILKTSEIKLTTGKVDKIGMTFFPATVFESIVDLINRHIAHNNSQDSVDLSLEITERIKNQCQIVLTFQCANYYSTDYDLQKFFKGESHIFEDADQILPLKRQLSGLHGAIDYRANQHDGVVFQLSLPCYLLENNEHYHPQTTKQADKASTITEQAKEQAPLPSGSVTSQTNNKAEQSATSATENFIESLNKIRILIVDDSRVSREALKSAIQHQAHYELTETNTGASAFDLMQKNDFDIVLTDIYMNDMNGMEFTRQIRFLPRCQDIPVIGLTAATDNALVAEFKRNGGTELITKPVEEDKLVELIEQYALSYALYDKSKADLHSNANEALQSKLTRLFLKEVEELLSAIEQKTDTTELANMAHKIVASSEYCGYMFVHRRAKLFERYVIGKAKSTLIRQSLDELHQALKLSHQHLVTHFK